MLRIVFHRLASHLRRNRTEREMDEEMRLHLELMTKENLRQGMSEEDARRAARRSFGGLEQVKEAGRDVRRLRWVETLWQDLRYGARILARNRLFTFVAITSLAFGIGANTAVFSIAYAVLLSPLPYPKPEQIVVVGAGSPRIHPLTGARFVELGKQNHAFENLSAFEAREFVLTGQHGPEQVKGHRISPELLTLFGVSPKPGRSFSAEEFQPGHDQVLLISHRLWQRRWGGDPDIVGRAVTLQQKSCTVIGVIPPDFRFFPDTDVFVPAVFDAEQLSSEAPVFQTLARLKPGITVESARNNAGIQVYPLREMIVRDFRPTLLVLWGAVVCVLLITCANFANLLLARAANRQKEIAVRMAVGACRGRIVRQLLTESVLLAVSGGAAGLFCARMGIDALLAAGPVNLPQWRPYVIAGALQQFNEFGINGWVIAFTMGVSVATGILFGLAPALKTSNPDLNVFLKESAAVAASGFRLRGRQRLQQTLVVAEIALALVLLAGAGLLVRSYWLLQQVKPGFQADNLLTFQLQFPWYRYREHSEMISFVSRTIENLEALPGVRSVAASSNLPLRGGEMLHHFSVEDPAFLSLAPGWDAAPVAPGYFLPPPPPAPPGKAAAVLMWGRLVNVSPRYFETMRIPVKQGREFAESDNGRSMPVALINEAMVRRYWSGKNPIGQRLRVGSRQWVTIIGIVGDSLQNAQEGKALPGIYRPLLQSVRRHTDYPESQALLREVDRIGLVVRTDRKPENLIAALQTQARNLDPDQPPLHVETMEAVLTKAVEIPRFNMLLFGIFAGAAFLLAVVGTYGLMAYLVEQRKHEIGIRRALGAQKSDVLRLVMSHGLKLVLAGVAVGLPAALALTRVIQNWLSGINSTDPLTFAGIVALLAGTALLACYLPAAKAANVDPLTALRHE